MATDSSFSSIFAYTYHFSIPSIYNLYLEKLNNFKRMFYSTHVSHLPIRNLRDREIMSFVFLIRLKLYCTDSGLPELQIIC